MSETLRQSGSSARHDEATATWADASLEHFVRVYEQSFRADLCDFLIQAFEQARHLQHLNGKRRNEALDNSQWTEIDISSLASRDLLVYVRQLVADSKRRYEEDIGIVPRLPEPGSCDRLRIKRYLPNAEDCFQPHYDSVRRSASRYLVFLWYLNDIDQGGETEFLDMNLSVAPRKGRLLMFPPYWMFRHRGNPPVDKPKYIISTYALWE